MEKFGKMRNEKPVDLESTKDSSLTSLFRCRFRDTCGVPNSLRFSENRSNGSKYSFSSSNKLSFSSGERSCNSSGISSSFRFSQKSNDLTSIKIVPDYDLLSKLCLEPVSYALNWMKNKQETDLSTKYEKERTLLMYLVMRDDPELIHQITSKAPSLLDLQDLDGRSALIHAVKFNKLFSALSLIEKGAKLDLQDRQGRTGCHIAAINNNKEMLLLLLAKGANLKLEDSFGLTALSYLPESPLKFDLSKDYPLDQGKKSLVDRKRTLLIRKTKIKGEKSAEERTPTEDVHLDEATIGPDECKEDNTQNTTGKNDCSINRDSRQSIQNGWMLEQFLGRGNFGDVYCARRSGTDKLLAVKEYSKRQMAAPELTKRLFSEKNAVSTIKSPFVVKGFEFFQTEKKLYIVMEYFPKRDLGSYLQINGALEEKEIRILAAQLIIAVETIHKRDFIHRDIKPDNVFIREDGNIILGDFGLCTKLKSGKGVLTKTFCGTLCYLAPEVMEKQSYGKAVDWYLLGETLFECAFGIPPFFDPCKATMVSKIKRNHLKFPPSHSYSASLVSLLCSLLAKDPIHRLGTKYGAAEIKRHHFFLGLDWQRVAEKQIPLFDPGSIPDRSLKQVGRVIHPVEENAKNITSLVGWST